MLLERALTGWREWTPVLVICSCLVLLPFGRSVELPVLIMAVWGIVLAVRNGRGWLWRGANRAFTLLFLLIWLPMVLALPDAVAFEKSFSTTAVHLRFYFAGLFIISVLAEPGRWAMFLRLSASVLLFWVADALVQAFAGRDLLGFEQVPARLNGIFGERHLKLGYVLAALSPLLIAYLQSAAPRWLRYLSYIALGVVILLAGSRAGWVMVLVAAGAFALWHFSQGRRISRLALALSLALLVGAGAGLYQSNPGFQERVDRTALVFEGDSEALDRALALRLPVWSTAVDIITANPINGVGPRGFRYAYPEFADADDPFLAPERGVGAYHAHQLWLEVAADTGLFGVLGLIGFHVIALAQWARADRLQRRTALPAAVCLLVALFPLNSHLAMFSSFWSQVVWWVVALYCGALAAGYAREPVTGRSPSLRRRTAGLAQSAAD